MFLGVLNISSNILDGSLAPKVSYEHFLMKNLPKIDSEEIWVLYYFLNMIREKRHGSGAFCLDHFLRVLWLLFFFLQLLWSLENVLKTNGMAIAALKSFVRPPEVKFVQKSASSLRLQNLNFFGFLEIPWKTARVRGFLFISFSTCPMATILFSTASVKSGECFENKRHGYSCSEKFCTASKSEICPKVSDQSQTPKF